MTPYLVDASLSNVTKLQTKFGGYVGRKEINDYLFPYLFYKDANFGILLIPRLQSIPIDPM